MFAQSDSTHVLDSHSDSLSSKFNIPIFSTTGADVDSDIDQQDVSSLLQSSRDVFTQFSSFQFSASRYRVRGYAQENQMILINGIKVDNPETGYASWSSWGGLNDVTRYTENRFGVVNNRYGFSGPGGYTNIDSKASSFKKGTRFSYGNSNRAFRNRFMLTHSTGMLKNGWALTFSASNRSGNEVYIPGTYFNASAYYISIDKKFNDKNLLSFTGFVAPIEQGRQSAQVLETFELSNTHYYNSQWGYQNGKVRNATISRAQKPMLMLTHNYKITTNSQVNTTISYNYGTAGQTGLNWNGATNPRPDYYRYLPSYYYDRGNISTGDYFKNRWVTDVNANQINWDRMIRINQANLYVLPSQLGQVISTTETRARYILENKVEDLKNIGFNSVYNGRIDKLFLSIGVNANSYRNRKYKIMEDLLGATFWLDYDQFAQNLGVNPSIQQNNIATPDRKVYVGDKFGYDYAINYNRAELWSQAEYTFEKIDVYAAANIQNSKIWREGFIANGKFPETSKGLSQKLNFLNYGLKGGLVYKITGRHFISANSSYMTRTPEVNNLFIAPRVRNDIVTNVGNERVTSLDANYQAKFPEFKLRFTYYYTQINNQAWIKTFWHDEYNNNVNLIMKGVNQSHQGVEFSFEKILYTSHVIQAAFGYGQFNYTNRPVLEAWQDNNALSLYTNRTVYLKNYKVGGTPQLVSGLGYKYNGKKFWFAGIYFNYVDRIYVDVNPDRRTQEAIAKYLSNETTQYHEIIDQTRLPGYYTVNINGGKSFRVLKKYFLNINLSANNIFNNKNNLVSGFEQLRWDFGNISKFDNKYYYMPGTTYMILLNFNF